MRLYKSYCYETIEQVADTIRSDPFAYDKTYLQDAIVLDADRIRMVLKNNANFIFTPPQCSKIGFNNSYTGLSISDSLELGGLITVALVSVWAIKIIRRAL